MSIQVIEEREVLSKDLKVYGDYENPLFLAKDVAEWIGYDKTQLSKMLKNIDDDDKARNNVTTLGGTQKTWFLTEEGLYEVLMQSRKPIAKQFKKEVKKILKDIRKHGMYAKDELLDNPDLMLDVITKLKQEKDLRLAAEQQIDELKPKALFADAVATSHTSILVGELAKIIKQNGVDIGATRLFEWLRANDFLIKRRGTDWNMPTQKSMNLQLFEVKETAITRSDGSVGISKTPKVTGKGQQYFINKFLDAERIGVES